MNKLYKIVVVGLVTVFSVCVFAGWFRDDRPRTIKVRCPYRSLQRAINHATEGERIRVVGRCDEAVEITTDDLTIVGPATINAEGTGAPAILIDGAHRVKIEHLTVKNGNGGLRAERGASVVLNHIMALNNSGSVAPGGNGVTITDNSTAEIYGMTASKNTRSGFVCSRSSSCRFVDTKSEMSDNGRDGLSCILASHCDVDGADLDLMSNKRNGLNVSTVVNFAVTNSFVHAEKNVQSLSLSSKANLLITAGTEIASNNNTRGKRVVSSGSVVNISDTKTTLNNNSTAGLELRVGTYQSVGVQFEATGNGKDITAEKLSFLRLGDNGEPDAPVQVGTAEVRFGAVASFEMANNEASSLETLTCLDRDELFLQVLGVQPTAIGCGE